MSMEVDSMDLFEAKEIVKKYKILTPVIVDALFLCIWEAVNGKYYHEPTGIAQKSYRPHGMVSVALKALGSMGLLQKHKVSRDQMKIRARVYYTIDIEKCVDFFKQLFLHRKDIVFYRGKIKKAAVLELLHRWYQEGRREFTVADILGEVQICQPGVSLELNRLVGMGLIDVNYDLGSRYNGFQQKLYRINDDLERYVEQMNKEVEAALLYTLGQLQIVENDLARLRSEEAEEERAQDGGDIMVPVA